MTLVSSPPLYASTIFFISAFLRHSRLASGSNPPLVSSHYTTARRRRTMTAEAEDRIPTRFSAALFCGRAALLQLRRGALDRVHGLRRCRLAELQDFPVIQAESRTS